MKDILLLYKKEGETPLEALETFRKKNKKYKDVKMTYAGRLDPMASGALLVLAGEEVKNKEKYLKLSKEYKFDVLFGFATDTYDILGKVVSVGDALIEKKELETKIKRNLKYFTGTFTQKYPLYSSKNIKRVRKGERVEASNHVVEIKSFKFLGNRKVSAEKLLQNIEKRIAKVGGDFRQKEILKIWRELLKVRSVKFQRIPPAFGVNLPRSKFPASYFLVASFHIKCGSGMYVRRLAHDLGVSIGIPALAFSIKRTKIGKWS